MACGLVSLELRNPRFQVIELCFHSTHLFYFCIEIVSPEYLFFELGRNVDEIVEKTKLSPEEIGIVFRFLKSEIGFIPFEQFSMLLVFY